MSVWDPPSGSTDKESNYWERKKHTWKKRTCAMSTAQVGDSLWTRALQIFEACEEINLNSSSSVLWIPELCRTTFFPRIFLQRLASCRPQCLFVRMSWVSVGFLSHSSGSFVLELGLDSTMFPCKRKLQPFVQEVRHFYKKRKTESNQWHYFISVKYQL